jgi:hypothetical protein
VSNYTFAFAVTSDRNENFTYHGIYP